MRKIKKTPTEVYAEFSDDQNYKQGINLFENVKRNNNFYHGRQWEGLNAPMLEKPVFNFIKPAINYMVSMLMSDDIGVSAELQNVGVEEYGDKIGEIIKKEVANVFEQNNVSYQNRESLTTCAIDGDTVRHHYFDPTTRTGFPYTGSIKTERIDNTNIVLGNRATNDIQSQPYIIIAMQLMTNDVKEMAKQNKMSDIDSICPDNELANYYNSEHEYDESKYTTVLLKYWKENGKVHFLKCTQNAMVQDDTATDMELYPISYMSWEKTKHCCHGESPVTAVIPDQVFVNKIYALAMEHTKRHAFPKIVYDKSKIKSFNNDVTTSIGVNGDPQQAIMNVTPTAQVNPFAIELAENAISKMNDSLGINAAALGNVRPDNTSAIVALQRASSQPLELQHQDFYQFIEDSVRIIVDMMAAYYGVRYTEATDESGNVNTVQFDFANLREMNYKLSVEIGAATYFSELANVQTLDNLLQMQLVDAETYLKQLPEGYVPGRDEIIQKMAEKRQQEEMAAQMQSAPQQMAQPQGPIAELQQAVTAPMQM